MIEILFGLVVVAVVYFVATYMAVKYTVDKLGARSGLFGVGLVSVVVGFILYTYVGEFGFAKGYEYWYEYPSMLYYVARFGFLCLGLGGIVMVAVDLLKAVNELGSYVSRTNEKLSGTQSVPGASAKSHPTVQENVPTWKRIQMEQETQIKK